MLIAWAARIVSLGLALLSGWLLGRSAPDWRGDSEVVGGRNYGTPGYYDQPLLVGGRGFFAGAWGAGLCALAAVLVVYYAWPTPPAIAEALLYDDSGVSLLFDPRLWLLVGTWLVGYIPSRLTDKGPVGPLE